ncbi:MAG: CBS domain-containing protein, partial [Acidimicrobiales bacterium]
MGRPRVIFDARNTVTEAAAKLERESLPGAPVVDEAGTFIGVVRRGRLSTAAGGAGGGAGGGGAGGGGAG